MYNFKKCEAIALDFRLKKEMFFINEPWSIPKVGREKIVTNTNLGDRDRQCLPTAFDLAITITLKRPV
ncbi:hypothetical protein NDI35_10210 [Microcoleus vaginatus FACHB-2002]